MDEIAKLMDKLETYEPTKTFQELAQAMPNKGGLATLASVEVMADLQRSTAATPKSEQP